MADVLEQLRAALGDRYDVERLVGEGGMATVFLARDLRHGRKVAIKTLRAELAASIGADRFLREITLAANLQHPNLLALYDSGDAEGILYYVMPFVEGESLRARLDREQQLPIHDAVRITREAAEALAYAHEHGVVHRDIKPENILLLNGHALVADFGIARALDAAGEKLTQTGMAVGTPHYMSPEQAMGADGADGRSDIYSLGCVLYELLVGQPPFDGPNSRAILARHTMEQVPSLTVVRPSIPDELEDAVLQSLEKTPADRYQKMSEMADALADLESAVAVRRTASRITAARRTTPRGTRATRATRAEEAGAGLLGRTGAKLWSLLGDLGVGAVLGGWLLWGKMGTAAGAPPVGTGGLDAHRIAVLYFRDRSAGDSLRYLADGLTEGLIRELGRVATLDVISPNGVAPYRDESVSRDSIARALGVGTLVQGSVEQDGDRVRVDVRLVDGGSGAEFQRESFEVPARDYLELGDSLSGEVASFLRERLGGEVKLREQQRRARSPDAWALVQRAEQMRKRADSLTAVGDTTGAVADAFDRADTLLAQAQALDPTWPDPLVLRGSVAYRRSRLLFDDPVRAEPWITKGMTLANEAIGLEPRNPDALELRGNLQYWRWLLNLASGRDERAKLLQAAREDLEAATRINSSQAGAWGSLSHLYNNTEGTTNTDVVIAARRAYEEDAYLDNADVILARLFYASYDLGQVADARHWCGEGQRRFPEASPFTECRLFLMTMRSGDPDPQLAWQLVDSLLARVPPQRREFQRLNAQVLVAAVLARAGLPDSARRVAQRARGGPDVDPSMDLAYIQAFVYMLTGDTADALASLRRHIVANPARASAIAADPGWWFRGLEGDPRFKQLVGGQ